MAKKPEQFAKGRQPRASSDVSGSDNSLLTFPDSSAAFLSSRPEWTVNGALLQTPDGRAARVTAPPFTWIDGAWETHVTILPIEAAQGAASMELKARVTPDTLRRWSEVGINPFLEACAQLQEYWRTAKPSEFARLTWL